MRLPPGSHLWHFDRSLVSTDGIKPLDGAVATLCPNEGKFSGAVAVEVGTKNLIKNGDFETGWFDNWYRYIEGIGTISINENSKDGQSSCRIKANDKKHYWVKQDYKTIEHGTYTLSAYFKLLSYNSGSIGIRIDIYYTDGTVDQHSTHVDYNKINKWQRLVVTADTDESKTIDYIRIYGVWSNRLDGDFIGDAVQLEAKPFPTSFTDGTRPDGILPYPIDIINPAKGTVAFWAEIKDQTFYENCSQTFPTLFYAVTEGAGRGLWLVVGNTSRKWQLQVKDENKNFKTIEIGDLSAGWHYFAFTWNSQEVNMYVDGSKIGTMTEPPLPSYFTDVFLGSWNTGNQANAKFDEFMSNKKLSSSEQIQSWYNADSPFTCPTILLDRTIIPQLMIGRTDGSSWADVSGYIDRAEVELGNIDQVGTGNQGGDSVVRTLSFTLRNGEDSFRPRDRNSQWNIFNGNYSPLLWPMREVVLRVAIKADQESGSTSIFKEPLGAGDGTEKTFKLKYYPLLINSETVYCNGVEVSNYTINYDTGEITTSASGTLTVDYIYYQDLFAGYMGDSIQSSSDKATITCECRDYGKRLQNAYIEEVKEYGSDEGVPAETVIQQLLNDNGLSDIELYCPISPGFMMYKTDAFKYMTVFDATQQIATYFGWFLGFRWANNKFRYTLMEPPRSKVDPDYTLTAADDVYKDDLDISDVDIRNVIKVTYRDKSTGKRRSIPLENPESIAEFGRRAMEIEEADTSLIDSEAEAVQFGNAALADLKDIPATVIINMPLFPRADLFDLIELDSPRNSSTVDSYGIDSVRHTLEFGEKPYLRTEVLGSGKVTGAHKKWLKMQTRPGAKNPINAEEIRDGTYTIIDDMKIANDDNTLQIGDKGIQAFHNNQKTVDIETKTGNAYFNGHVIGAVYNE